MSGRCFGTISALNCEVRVINYSRAQNLTSWHHVSTLFFPYRSISINLACSGKTFTCNPNYSFLFPRQRPQIINYILTCRFKDCHGRQYFSPIMLIKEKERLHPKTFGHLWKLLGNNSNILIDTISFLNGLILRDSDYNTFLVTNNCSFFR